MKAVVAKRVRVQWHLAELRHSEGSKLNKHPDFYMSAAGEVVGDLAAPRACWVRARVRDVARDDHMLIEVAPPVMGQPYGLGSRDIGELIISARFQGSTLFPITEWPCHVYIARVLDRGVIESLAVSKKEQIEVIAWGSIFRTLEEVRTSGDHCGPER